MNNSIEKSNTQTKFSISLNDATNKILAASNVYELLGYKDDDFINGNITLQNRLHAHDQDISDELFSNNIKHASGTLNFRLRHIDNTIRCVKVQYTKAIVSANNSIRLELILQDAKSLRCQQSNQTVMTNFRAMMDNTDDFIYFKDRNHVFTGASQTLVAVTEPTEHWMDLIGLTDYDVFPEAYADAYYSLEKQVFAGIQIAREEQEYIDNEGNKGWVDNRKYPIRGAQGEIVGLFGIARDVTNNKKIEAELKEKEERLVLATNHNGIGVWDWDLQTSELVWDDSMFSLYHIKREDFKNVIDAWEKLLHPDDKEHTTQAVEDAILGKKPYSNQFRIIWPKGEVRNIKAMAKVFFDDTGKPLRMLGTNIDITEQKQAEDSLRIAAAVFESQEGMLVTDANNIILRVNKAFTETSGYSTEEVVGQTPHFLKSGKHSKEFYTSMWESINKTGRWEGEIWDKNKSGEIHLEHLTITAVKNTAGVLTNYVATYSDITMSQAAADEIRSLAFYDPLTLLPNRRLLRDRLNQALAASSRSGLQGALLFLDLDNFKTLNDTLGHDVGDLLLQQVAIRLSACVREGDSVARLGGDEFVIILENLSRQAIVAAATTETVAGKIFLALNQPYQLNSQSHHSTVSIGATLFNSHEVAIDELLKQADIAMYQSKNEGRNTLRFFDPKMQEAIASRVEIERELREAIEKNQFQLHYQIQVDRSGKALGAEALIRWIHPQRGLISPINFIPLAEETGQILAIGQWVLNAACVQLKKWEQKPLTRNFILAVNVSAKQFHQVDFVEKVLTTIDHHGINPNRLKLELTESMLVDNINDIISKMKILSEKGVSFSLDDFGTGYSSLQYLKKLPLNQLKIDRSFVRDIVTDSSDRAIVRTIITMAQSLDIKVIAEGVETEEQRLYLMENNCFHYQGYLFSKPVAIDIFEELIGHH